jgi:tetratricopeptide (TPR) repeat protein
MAALNKHFEKAERLRQKGKFEQALEELLLARKDEPSNDEIVLAVADVYQRLGRPRECRQCYGFLFDKYLERKDPQRALEYFAKLQKLGAVDAKRLLACAKLFEKQQPKEAAGFYRQAIEVAGENDPETSLQSLEGLAGLEPASVEAHQRVAELASQLGKTSLAASSYSRVGNLLATQRKFAEASDALENAYRLSPESAATKMALVKACSHAKLFPRVIELLGKPESQNPDQPPEGIEDPQVLGMLAEAYYAEKQFPEAEAAYWQLAENSPEAFLPLTEIAVEYLRRKEYSVALPKLKELEQKMVQGKNQQGLMALAEGMSRVELTEVELLEFLSHLADQVHLDGPLAKSLHGLFDIYFASGDFRKATDILERLIEVDPYAVECSVNLRKLEGKVDPGTWKELALRLGYTSTASKPGFAPASQSAASATTDDGDHDKGTHPSTAGVRGAESASENTLGDLILQAEIFLQYNLQDKARERLERIAKLFPGEEEKNGQLRDLIERIIGLDPHSEVPAASHVTLAPAGSGASRIADLPLDWSGISEVIRNLSRPGTVKGVLSAAVNGIGRLWKSSRCVAGLAKLKQPPTVALEYIAPGVSASDAHLLGKLVMGLQQITEERAATLAVNQVSAEGLLAPLKALLDGLQVESLVAVPLREDDQPAGILILEQCGTARRWRQDEVTALETIADQVVFASSNARLRNLMKTLAVKDERSGLLHRDSYLLCLLSEAERLRTQKTPLAVAILDFSASRQGAPERRPKQEDAALGEFMRQFPRTFASQLRQNDIPLKYGPQSLAVILPGTGSEQAAFIVEKIRKLSASFSASISGGSCSMAAGIAQAVQDAAMDSADVVTELINRVEEALAEARTIGSNATKILNAPPPPSPPQ